MAIQHANSAQKSSRRPKRAGVIARRPSSTQKTYRRAVVAIPTYNERDNLSTLLPAILENREFDVLIVDDNSPDGTAELVLDFVNQYPGRVHLIQREGKLGLGTAYLAAFRWALKRDYELICQMDADFSHDPNSLPLLVKAAEQADLVIGSRYTNGGGTENWSALRKLISRGGSLYARKILNVSHRDLTGGFKCFRRNVLETIDLDSITSCGYVFQIETSYRAHQAGFQIQEVPIVFHERRAGQSKMSSGIIFEAFFKVWQLRLASRRKLIMSESHAR